MPYLERLGKTIYSNERVNYHSFEDLQPDEILNLADIAEVEYENSELEGIHDANTRVKNITRPDKGNNEGAGARDEKDEEDEEEQEEEQDEDNEDEDDEDDVDEDDENEDDEDKDHEDEV